MFIRLILFYPICDPMTKTILLGILVSAVLMIGIVAPALAHLSWQGILSDSITNKNANTKILSLTATAPVPKRTSTLAGFAWLYTGGSPNSAFAITIHKAGDVNGDTSEPPNDVRDSTQNPDGWHAHNVNLGAGAGAATFCVTAIVDAPNVGIGIKGSQIDVQVKNSVLTGTLSTTSAAFDIIIEPACPITAGTSSTTAGPLPLGIVVDSLNP